MNTMHLISEVTSMTNNELPYESLPDTIIDSCNRLWSTCAGKYMKEVLSPDRQVAEIFLHVNQTIPNPESVPMVEIGY
jgi:hypothetical protein